jgi:hypothetical protein
VILEQFKIRAATCVATKTDRRYSMTTVEETGTLVASMSRRQRWVKIIIVYALVVCTGFLFAYAEFRACGGDGFSAVVLSLPGARGSVWSRPSVVTWEQRLSEGASDTYDGFSSLTLTLSYGRQLRVLPLFEPLPSHDDLGRDWYSRRITEEGQRFTLCIDVRTRLSDQAFEERYPGLLASIVQRVENPPLSGTLRARVALVHTLSINRYSIFPGGATAVGLNELASMVVGLPGWVILPLLIVVPSWLALPVFWALVTSGILYVLLPSRAWTWMRHALQGVWSVIRHGRSM